MIHTLIQWMLAAAMLLSPTIARLVDEPDDACYTDTCVGCVDDCLS